LVRLGKNFSLQGQISVGGVVILLTVTTCVLYAAFKQCEQRLCVVYSKYSPLVYSLRQNKDSYFGVYDYDNRIWQKCCGMLYLLGPLIPYYRSLLLGTCLRACKDSDALIRASAISNLGQVCQHLHFSLGPVMYEVLYLNCGHSMCNALSTLAYLRMLN